MACRNSALGTKIKTPQAGLTVVSPVRPHGFPVFYALQNHGAYWTCFDTGAAAGAVVVGKKDFPHKKLSHYQVEYREQWDEIQKGNRPDHFIEVVARYPKRIFPKKKLEIPFGFALGPGYDPAGMFRRQRGMNEGHIHRHIKADGTFGAAAFEQKNQSREKGRQPGRSRKKKRPNIKTAPRGDTEKMSFLFPRQSE